MKAIEILFPVFFMMVLGWLCRKRRWITDTQNNGAKSLVFKILFPILVFDVLAKANLSSHFILEILFLDVAWILIYLVGNRVSSTCMGGYSHIASFLLMTCEGGSVALPLYINLVGAEHAANIITFDVAGILINFGLVPSLITQKISTNVALKPLFKRILTAPFIIAVILGIVVNLSGLYQWVMQTTFCSVLTATMNAITTPIASIILFTLGYEFQLHSAQIKPLIRLSILRLMGCGAIVGLFFIFFPVLMANKFFLIGVLIYFACPTGFPVPLQIERLCRGKEDEGFMSAFISIFIVFVMTAYAVVTLFIL